MNQEFNAKHQPSFGALWSFMDNNGHVTHDQIFVRLLFSLLRQLVPDLIGLLLELKCNTFSKFVYLNRDIAGYFLGQKMNLKNPQHIL